MHLFYTPEISVGAKDFVLSEEESRHAIKVLRLQINSEVYLVDGKGGFYTALIREANPKHCSLQIINEVLDFGKRDYYLHVAIAPTKNIDRFEWFLEKATEVGIDEITPIISQRSERKKLRTDRLQKVITSAVKQSIKAYHPKLNEVVTFSDFISQPSQGYSLKCIAHCDEGDKQTIAKQYKKGNSLLVLIGPEGDFTPDEVELALKNDYQPISLGKNRLRTETAGLAVCFEAAFLNV